MLALGVGKVIVCEIAKLLFELPFDHIPVAFEGELIHVSSSASRWHVAVAESVTGDAGFPRDFIQSPVPCDHACGDLAKSE